jgi:hypothetical protein
MRTETRHQIVLGIVGGALFLVALGISASVGGCVFLRSGSLNMGEGGPRWNGVSWMSDDVVRRSIDSTTSHQIGQALSLETDNGTIKVVKAGEKDVVVKASVRATTQERADALKIVTARDAAGKLQVSIAWPDGKRQPNEGADLTIEIPDVNGLEAQTSNGSIELGGFAGPAKLETSNGQVVVREHKGTVRAVSSNGGIELIDVDGADADTSNGDIDIKLSDDATGPLKADTSNGGIDVYLGKGFKGTLACKTSNGNISNNLKRAHSYRKESTRTNNWNGKESGTFEIGEGPAGSLTTSNGNIEVGER